MTSLRRHALRNLIVALLAAAAPLASQEPAAGPWIPLGSRLDREVRWAIDAGGLRLNPHLRPFRLGALRQAVDRARSDSLSGAALRSVERVRRSLESLADSVHVSVEAAAQGYTNARRETFRAGGASGFAPAFGLWGSARSGPLIAVVNPAIDERLRDDPEFAGEKTTEVTGRMQTAYLALSGSIGDLVLGRMARNWGTDLFDGLLVSSMPYAFDALSGAVRIGRFELTSVAQRLSGITDTTGTGADFNRYFFAHRLDIRLGRDTWLGLTESGVYGGPGESLQPAFHMPLNPALVSAFNDSVGGNFLVGVDFATRLGRQWRLEFSAYLDDIQTDDQTLTDQRPTAYGAAATVRYALPEAPVHVALGYSRVSYLSYRNSFEPELVYAHQNVGLARNYSDYDQLLLRIATAPTDRWTAWLDASYYRQGSGDFRQAFPPDSVLATPGHAFLVAPVTKFGAARISVEGEVVVGLSVGATLGVTRGTTGATETIASLTARLAFDMLGKRWGASYPGIERRADLP